MTHKTLWKLGCITTITGEGRENEQARRVVGAATPGPVAQTAAPENPGGVCWGVTRDTQSVSIL